MICGSRLRFRQSKGSGLTEVPKPASFFAIRVIFCQLGHTFWQSLKPDHYPKFRPVTHWQTFPAE